VSIPDAVHRQVEVPGDGESLVPEPVEEYRMLAHVADNHILDGCGHWVQQERPAEVNRLLIDWLATARL
jgi:pimeloyl-ACP methyl ester carboxylesterase